MFMNKRQRRGVCFTSRVSFFRVTINVALSTGVFLITGYVYLLRTSGYQVDQSTRNGHSASPNFKPYTTENGEFCVLPNVILADRYYRFSQSDHVTLVTQSSLHYIDSALEQSRLWDGPVSFVLYVENVAAMEQIHSSLLALRECEADFRDKVSVHIFYPSSKEDPLCPIQRLSSSRNPLNATDCKATVKAILQNLIPPRASTAVKSKSYPVNVARNIARRASSTLLILVADVELLPNENFSAKFMEFYKTRHKIRPKEAFVVPVFELSFSRPMPRTKEELYEEARNEYVFPFHYKRIAYECHRIPALGKWWHSGAANRSRMAIFSTTAWVRPCWEPVFLSLASDTPFYDERFRGYGKNKIQQVYEMCRANFTFHILDNAFFIHRNISILSENEWKEISHTVTQNNELFERFRREIDTRYENNAQRKYCDTAISMGTPFVKRL